MLALRGVGEGWMVQQWNKIIRGDTAQVVIL